MTPLRVCVAGATGWVGRALVPAIASDSRFSLVGAVSRAGATMRVPELWPDVASEVRITATVVEALAQPTDVLIDFTEPEAAQRHAHTAIERGVHVVVGTSGLDDAAYAEIDRAARRHAVGVLGVGNFAISAVLLQHFAVIAARFLPSWEIVDYASANKPDAPSGTARELASRLAEVGRSRTVIPISETVGEPAARGVTAGGTQIHSIRLPGHVIGAEVLFGAPSERLSLRYDGGNGPEPYIAGALLAIAHVREHVGVRRGLDELLGLRGADRSGVAVRP
jgi:4-hydroxy-tetrahydrodipicolinate reductase